MKTTDWKTKMVRVAAYVWAAPNTLAAVSIGLLLGARFQRIDGVVEMHGPRVAWILRRLPVSALALTMGHAIFGQNPMALEMTRQHEHVHVRQYERWGPFFIPAYVGISAYLGIRGRDAYLENPFEQEAFAKAPI